MRRLASLNPHLTMSQLTGEHELMFDCPVCGLPYQIYLRCRINGPATTGVWAIALPERASGDGWARVSLSPSIKNTHHGRKKRCTAHITITDGDVILN